MTFEVYFNAEDAFLLSVKQNLLLYKDNNDKFLDLAIGSSCCLSCLAALESIVNKMIQQQNKISHWDELRIASKIDTLVELEGEKIDWGSSPWQKITKLIKLRNWLSHNKESYIGLSGYKDVWITDSINKYPKIDPEKELNFKSITRFYNAVRSAGLQLSKILNIEDEYKFLKNEEYYPIIS